MLEGKYGDWRRADSLRIVILVLTLVVVGLLCYFLGVVSSNLQVTIVTGDRLVAGFVLFTVVVLAIGAIGRSPRMLVSLEGDRIEIGPVRDAASSADRPALKGRIESVMPITEQRYHEHYSRFRGVRKFGRARSGDSVILITTRTEQIVLAIPRKSYLEIEPGLDRFKSSDLIAA